MRVGGVNLVLPANISNTAAAANNALIINNNNLSTDTSGGSQASSSQSVQQDDRPIIGESDRISLCLLLANGDDDVSMGTSFFCWFYSTVNDGRE